MKTIDIPGGTAQLREGPELRGRDRNLIQAAILVATAGMAKVSGLRDQQEGEPDDDYRDFVAQQFKNREKLTIEESLSLVELSNAAIVSSLKSWSLPDPLPTIENVDELPGDLYQALVDGTGGISMLLAAGVKFEPTDPKGPEGRSTPTGGSSSSSNTSPEPTTPDSPNSSVMTLPTLTPQNGTESTATESSTPA
jgi:hypothetical protein